MKSPRELMRADLKRSGLNGTDEDTLHLAPLDAAAVRKETRGKFGVPAYSLPYFDLAGNAIDFRRLRFLADVRDPKGKLRRYWQPPKTSPQIYFPPYIDWRAAALNTGVRLVITEGEKKSAAGTKALGVPVAGLGGIWNFMSKKLGLDLLPALANFALDSRQIFIAFDGGIDDNPDGAMAQSRFGAVLAEREADVYLVRLPNGTKLDDFLLRKSADDFWNLPIDALDLRTSIRTLRLKGTAALLRNEAVADLVEADCAKRGAFHYVDRGESREPLYFDRIEHSLIRLAKEDDPHLGRFLENTYGLNPTSVEYKFTQRRLRSRALGGTPVIPRRFAHYVRDAATLYLDMGDHRVAKVTAKGWDEVPNGTDDVLFSDNVVARVAPAKRGSKNALHRLLTLPNFHGGECQDCLTPKHQRLVFALNFWSMFFPSLLPTRPLVLIHAVRGSGKTMGPRCIGIVLFGPSFDVQLVETTKMADVVTSLATDPYVVLDNLDGKYPELENYLAMAATGGVVKRRAYYTTNDKAEYRLAARIIATSREPDVFLRDDIRDRTMILAATPLKKKLPESVFIDWATSARPALWRTFLDTLPRVVKALASAKVEWTEHRLADFAHFASVVGPVLGYARADVADALDGLEAERTAFAAEHSKLLRSFDALIDYQMKLNERRETKVREPLGLFNRTAGEIMEALNAVMPVRGEPAFRSADKFGHLLKNELTTLRATYVVTRREGSSKRTEYTITPRTDADK